MARAPKARRPIETYTHGGQRLNNPPVGLVARKRSANGSDDETITYDYDPHMDPKLAFQTAQSQADALLEETLHTLETHSPEQAKALRQRLMRLIRPHLTWTGKAKETSFSVPSVALYTHERIEPHALIKQMRKVNGAPPPQEKMLFNSPQHSLSADDALDFYRHPLGWSNRLIAGDSLLVMNSLLQKESMAGKVQMIYFDPPYGIGYKSNFQFSINKQNVAAIDRDEDLTQEPEQICAFRDTWELGIHSYLTYLRDRLLLAREMLATTGSCFVQISDENVHLVRVLMDEVFEKKNFIRMIYYTTTSGLGSSFLKRKGDYLLWYAKDRAQAKFKYHQLFLPKPGLERGDAVYRYLELPDGTRRQMTKEEREGSAPLPQNARIFSYGDSQSQGGRAEDDPYEFEGTVYHTPPGRNWKASYPEGMDRLKNSNRLGISGKNLLYVRYVDDFPVIELDDVWGDTSRSFASDKRYVVETSPKVVARCMLMCTDPGDLVFDPTCGSGTTAFVAEQWGRRWITCDTSRVAITLAKERLMTAKYPWYQLETPEQDVGGGFVYRTVPYVTLRSIANNENIKPGMTRGQIEMAINRNAEEKTLYDLPEEERGKVRVSGLFTYEAVPAPTVLALEQALNLAAGVQAPAQQEEASPQVRSRATANLGNWIEELRVKGLRGKGGAVLELAHLERCATPGSLQAQGETKEEGGSRSIRVSFGPDHAPLSPQQVERALQEAQELIPQPEVLAFCAFQFDPESERLIHQTRWQDVQLLAARMNMDLQVGDLKRNTKDEQSFWLMGQPDAEVLPVKEQDANGNRQVQVRVNGFDYIDLKHTRLKSGSKKEIAMWLLDPDYDGRSLCPRQVFFPSMNGWKRLAEQLSAELDTARMEAFKGTLSLPFAPGKYARAAVKIIDDRGIESIRVLDLATPTEEA